MSAQPSENQPVYLLEENHDLPLCRLRVTVRTGAVTDPGPGVLSAGLCNFATELMRRGAGGKTRAQIDEAVDGLGASLHVLCGYDSVVFETLSLKEKLPQVCALLSDMVLRPDFPQDEAARLQRELRADLDDMRDDDGTLARRFFSRALFGDHPYGRPVSGVEEGLAHLSVEGAQKWHRTYLRSGNLMFGAAGDLNAEEMHGLFDRHFASLPQGPRLDQPVPEPKVSTGLRVVLVDKPERSQSQILLGQLGPRWSEPTWLPMQVATTAFGGTFTARLMTEVREKRGLSYGASARMGSGRGRRSLSIHVFPSAQQTPETLELLLRLYEEWAAGLRPEETEFARGYLQKSHAFSVQTPESRLSLRTDLVLCDLPEERMRTYPQRVLAVTDAEIDAAIKHHLRPRDLLLTIVCTARTLQPRLSSMPALRDVPIEVVAHDSY